MARVRAERKCGDLLNVMDKAKGAAGTNPRLRATTASKTLSEVTKDQSSKWQKPAAEAEFEAAMNETAAKPSANNVLKEKSTPVERMDSSALWIRVGVQTLQSKFLRQP